MALDMCSGVYQLSSRRGCAYAHSRGSAHPELSADRPAGGGERGAELVEFGFVVAALMMLMLGIVAFARAYNTWQTMTRAAREGARVAALPNCASCGNAFLDPTGGTTAGPIFTDYIAPSLRASSLNPALVKNYSETVNWLNPTDAWSQCGVIITFQYPYTLEIPFTTASLATINLTTEVRMRLENQPLAASCGGNPLP